MIERPVLTLKEAAEACQVNLKTIRRPRDKGDFPNSYRSVDHGVAGVVVQVAGLADIVAALIASRAPQRRHLPF